MTDDSRMAIRCTRSRRGGSVIIAALLGASVGPAGAQALTIAAGAWAIDQFERASLGPDWFQFTETGAGTQGTVVISDGHNAQTQSGADGIAGFSPFTPQANTNYACIQETGSIEGQEACVCLGVDESAHDAMCCCLKSGESVIGFEMFGWVDNVPTNPVPPTNSPHTSGDYIGIRRTAANTFRCSYAAQAAPTSWSDLTGDVIVNNVTNPGRGGLYFYGDQLRVAQFEVGSGSALPTAHLCGAATAPPGSTATATAPGFTPTATPVPATLTHTPTATPAPPTATPTRTATPGLCGNSNVDPGEQCDDGNTANGDCCNSTCHFEPSGSSCNDLNTCTTGETCNSVGHCVVFTSCNTSLTCNICGSKCTLQAGVCKCG